MTSSLLSAADKAVETVANGDLSTKAMTVSERIAYSFERTLIGVIIVFGVLAVIFIVLSLFKFIFYKAPNGEKIINDPPSVPKSSLVANTSSDEEIVAAIVAAITAARNEEGSHGGFRVVSFKRVGKSHAWNVK